MNYKSNILLRLRLDYPLLNLSLLRLSEPSLYIINALIECPRLELLLWQVVYLPPLVLEHFLGKFMHFSGLLRALTRSELFQVEVNGDLLIVEHEMQHKQVVYRHERYRVDEAASVEETLEVVVGLILLDVLFKLVHVEVSLCVPQFVLVV